MNHLIRVTQHKNAGGGDTMLRPEMIISVFQGGDNNAVIEYGDTKTGHVTNVISIAHTLDELEDILSHADYTIHSFEPQTKP